jgi:chemotaxis protein histidine kinase CheA
MDTNEMMLELFRAEVESHSEAMTSGLLSLEQNPSSTQVIDGMMRAAHSIKGAARIVQVDQAVRVAHVMEDCFVAAQRKQLTLNSGSIDTLLRGVDLLGQVSEASRSGSSALALLDTDCDEVALHLKAILAGEQAPPSIPTTKSKSPAVQQAPKPAATSVSAAPTIAVAPAVKPPIAAPPAVKTAIVTPITMPAMIDSAHLISLNQEIRNAIRNAQGDGSGVVSLDFSKTTDISGTGLAFLMSLDQDCAKAPATKLELRNVSPSMAKLLNLASIKTPGTGSA